MFVVHAHQSDLTFIFIARIHYKCFDTLYFPFHYTFFVFITLANCPSHDLASYLYRFNGQATKKFS